MKMKSNTHFSVIIQEQIEWNWNEMSKNLLKKNILIS